MKRFSSQFPDRYFRCKCFQELYRKLKKEVDPYLWRLNAVLMKHILNIVNKKMFTVPADFSPIHFEAKFLAFITSNETSVTRPRPTTC